MPDAVTDENAHVLVLLPLAKRVARRLAFSYGCAWCLDELVSDGMAGALRAARTYRSDYGVPIEAYAVLVITGAIKNGIRSRGYVTERVLRTLRQADEAAERITRVSNRQPTPDELETAVPGYRKALVRVEQRQPFPLDGPERVFGAPAAPAAETVALAFFESDAVRAALLRLPVRERDLIQAHYFDETELRDIAPQQRVSQQRISQIHLRALAHLRDLLTTNDGQIAV